jgi:hypothetical protein
MERESTASHEDLAALANMLEKLDRELSEGRERELLLRAQHSELVGQLKSGRERASDLAWELEDLEQRLRDLADQRGGPIDPLLERELTSMAGQRMALEEQLLTELLRIDELLASIAAGEQALDTQERLWLAREQALIAERERIASLL